MSDCGCLSNHNQKLPCKLNSRIVSHPVCIRSASTTLTPDVIDAFEPLSYFNQQCHKWQTELNQTVHVVVGLYCTPGGAFWANLKVHKNT